MNFEQLTVETQDGYFRRSIREDRKMQFKNTVFRSSKRSTNSSPFLRVEIELTNDVKLVQRVYPNLIDLVSEIGSILPVLTLLCVLIGSVHNQILFDMEV